MKKYIIFLIMALVCAGGLFAQSLQDNENYKKSVEFARLSEEAFQLGDYDIAREHAIKSQEYAALYRQSLGISYAGDRVAFYKVKRGDCLWRISLLDFIYGDAYQWERIYEANRSILHDPNNPHLIFAGQRLTIPSISGEARSGER